MSNQVKTPIDQLDSLLGFNSSQPESGTKQILEEVIAELKKQRLEEGRAKIRQLLVEAVKLRNQAAELDKTYKQARQKVDSGLGKLLKEIDNLDKASQQLVQEEET